MMRYIMSAVAENEFKNPNGRQASWRARSSRVSNERGGSWPKRSRTELDVASKTTVSRITISVVTMQRKQGAVGLNRTTRIRNEYDISASADPAVNGFHSLQ